MPGKRLLSGFLLLVSGQALAWTGISASVGEYDADWRIDGVVHPVTMGRYGLAVEDQTQIGLRLGLAVGQFALRLRQPDGQLLDDYTGEYIDLRMHWPVRVSSALALHGRFAYAWHSGQRVFSTTTSDTGTTVSTTNADDGIGWSRSRVGLGLQLALGRVSVQPFFEWQRLDGDIAVNSGRRSLIEQDTEVNQGIMIDIAVDPNGFVRFTWFGEGRRGLLLSFVRAN